MTALGYRRVMRFPRRCRSWRQSRVISLRHARRSTVATVVAFLLVGFASGGRSEAQTPTRVEWRHQRLSITAVDTPLAPILREIALRTGSRVVGLEHATERVTIDMRDRALLDAVRALLAEVRVNYLYTPRVSASGRGESVTLWLYGASVPRGLSSGALIVDGAAAASADEPTVAVGFAPQFRDDEVTRLSREGAFDAKATRASLLGLARSPDPDVRILALQTLALQPTAPVVEAIKAALRDENIFVRGEAMVLVRNLGLGADTVNVLGGFLEHEDPEVRGVAAMALGELEHPQAGFLLERALKDGDGAVRGFAARALQEKQATEKPKR